MHERQAANAPEAAATASPDGITLRELRGPDDFRACYDLQRQTWGRDFEGVVSMSVLKIVQRTGGTVAGAFAADDRMLGFVLGLAGVRRSGSRGCAAAAAAQAPPAAAPGAAPDASRQPRRPEVFHWSHMLAVVPEARDLGLGTRLKWYQRELLLPLGVEMVEWTFDPLEARNAHLNLNLLGAEVVEYAEDMYKGEMGSDLARGIGTDRFVVSWRLSAVAPHAGGGAPAHGAAAGADGALRAAAAADRFRPFQAAPLVAPDAVAQGGDGEPPLPDAPRVRIEVPPRIQELKETQPERALAYRMATRRAFGTYLARGYRVTAFFRDPEGRCCYGVEAGRP